MNLLSICITKWGQVVSILADRYWNKKLLEHLENMVEERSNV